MSGFRNVLIINAQSMFKKNATGITLRNLWSMWPEENILELYSEPYFNSSSSSIRLHDNLPQSFIHSIEKKRSRRGVTGILLVKRDRINHGIHKRNSFKLFINCISLNITKDVWERIYAFAPDVVYTLGASINILRLVNKVAKRLDLPIIVHYMDNWKNHLNFKYDILVLLYHRLLIKELRNALKRSNVCFTISPYMAEEYNKDSRIKHIALMNCIHFNNNNDQQSLKKNMHCLKIIYAGGLHLNRWKPLSEVSKILSQYPFDAKLIIYTKKSDREMYSTFFSSDTTEFKEEVSHEDVIAIYNEADALIHVESKDDEVLPFIEYSLSTKLPEYLASGKPFIYYGPSNIAMYKYLYENHVAYVSDELSGLKNTLDILIEDLINGKNRYSVQAQDIAEQYHNQENVFKILKESIELSVSEFRKHGNS